MKSLKKINILTKGRPRILLAPLDWGLGHSTRCIPVVKAFQKHGATVVVACNESQAHLFRSEIPDLQIFSLPGYNLQYSRSKKLTQWKIFVQIPKILTSIKRENRWLSSLLEKEKFDVVISDNRYGMHHPSCFSIFITHQLRIKIPFSNWLEDWVQKWNYHFINQFNECWIPDFEDEPNIAGTLSHPKRLPSTKLKYLGPISRFENESSPVKTTTDLVVLISGPEPQRSIFENLVLSELQKSNNRAVIVRGLPEQANQREGLHGISFFNHLPAAALNRLLLSAQLILARSGYSSIMDIMKLNKKSILIPTPGQTEQEYLAKFLMQHKWSLSFQQDQFSLQDAINQSKVFEYADMQRFSGNNLESIIQNFMKDHFNETIQR